MMPAKVARAQAMLKTGHTQAEIADQLGISTSVLSAALNVEGE
jgi:DNA-binding CsgD family transcriptional regulator